MSGAKTGSPTSGAKTGSPTSGAKTGSPTSGAKTGSPTSGAKTGALMSGAKTETRMSGAKTGAPMSGAKTDTLMNGAKIVLECLTREKVEMIFGYPGGVTLPLYDALYDHPIKHVLVRHEQNAGFAAEGYARATGKVGVCCATSGPGATNLVTGLVDAMMDSIPIVAITGQVTTKLIGSDAFQEADTFGITRSCTKHNFLVKKLAELPQAIHEAFHIASTGRPGPVLVDITKDVFQAQAHYSPVSHIHLPGYKVYTEGHAGQIRRAAQMIWEAERPFVYAGGGIIAADAARRAARIRRAASTRPPSAR